MYRIYISCLLTMCCAALGEARMCAAEEDLKASMEKLRSKDPGELLEAIKTITASKDADAWKELLKALQEEPSLQTLETRIVPKDEMPEEGMLNMELVKDLHAALRMIAEGADPNSWQTLLALCDADVFKYSWKDPGFWRNYLLYDAFKYVRSEDKKWIEFLGSEVSRKNSDGEQRGLAFEALAVIGSESSSTIIGKIADEYWKSEILALHRGKSSNLRILVATRQYAGSPEYADENMRYLLDSEIYTQHQANFKVPRSLPKYEVSTSEERRALVEIFKSLLADPGKQPLKDDQKKKIAEIIEQIEKAEPKR